MKIWKKLCGSIIISVLVVLLASCGLMKEVAVEAVRDTYGDEYADAYEAEYDAAMEQLEQEWDKLDAELKEEMQDEYEAMKAQLKDEWDAKKEALKAEAQSAIQEEFGDQAEAAQELVDAGVAWIDSLFGPKWDYPVVDPKCSWRGFEEETWSWSEAEFCDGRARDYHLGLDLKSKTGNLEIRAAADGVVKFASKAGGASDGNGYHVILEHDMNGETVYSLYSHLADYKDLPAEGSMIKRGEKIGTMGNTGVSGGVHLHFSVYKGYSSSPDGRAHYFTGDSTVWKGITFYNPKYLIENDKLPEE